VFAPVYALRDVHTWGCGDLLALARLGEWAAERGASILATLPLLPAFLDRPYDPSPYRPVSRRFWNELYLAIPATREFARSRSAQARARSPSFRRRIASLERRRWVDFRSVARLKRSVLERMLGSFDRDAPRERRRAFRRFLETTDGVREYARFRASKEPGRRTAERYHLFVQWLVDEQMREVTERLYRSGVDLLLDLPIGIHPEGFDAQYDRELLVPSMSVGSPPDPGVPRGQDWGFPPFAPDRLRAAGYRPWVGALRHHYSAAKLLRVDHILGLHRLFWIPEGSAPADGVYVRYPAEELYAVLRAEAARVGSQVVGEDLGTVPRELRPALHGQGILRLFVAQLEWGPEGRARRVPADCVASLNTHDHAPFAAYWRDRVALSSRRHAPRTGADDLERRPWDAFADATLALARSPARFVVINLEDLWGETRAQNVPGESGPKYFSGRFRRGLAALNRHRAWSELICAVDALRRGRHGRWRRPQRPGSRTPPARRGRRRPHRS
jgi:4-alpha-glucanotransferase